VSALPWTIRPATRRDLNALMAIEQSQFPEPWSRRMLLEEITDATTRRYRVAVERGAVIGYVGAMFVMDEMHINTIGTRRGDEGRGVATSLLDELWPAARARGVSRATLEVAASNVRAQALYRRFGFAPVGVRRNYYQRTGEDALVLWAELGGDGHDVTPTIAP
jgi:ribosomal-protein-alanine N-acetyltransferase